MHFFYLSVCEMSSFPVQSKFQSIPHQNLCYLLQPCCSALAPELISPPPAQFFTNLEIKHRAGNLPKDIRKLLFVVVGNSLMCQSHSVAFL